MGTVQSFEKMSNRSMKKYFVIFKVANICFENSDGTNLLILWKIRQEPLSIELIYCHLWTKFEYSDPQSLEYIIPLINECLILLLQVLTHFQLCINEIMKHTHMCTVMYSWEWIVFTCSIMYQVTIDTTPNFYEL